VVFQPFPGQNHFFFDTFQGILFICMWIKTLQNCLLNTEISYTMYSSILNIEWTLIFELQMLYVMNCKKINKCMGNKQCNRHLHFPGQHYRFQGFFQTFPYLWAFSRLFKALKISTLNSKTFHTFPGSVRTLKRPV